MKHKWKIGDYFEAHAGVSKALFKIVNFSERNYGKYVSVKYVSVKRIEGSNDDATTWPYSCLEHDEYINVFPLTEEEAFQKIMEL